MAQANLIGHYGHEEQSTPSRMLRQHLALYLNPIDRHTLAGISEAELYRMAKKLSLIEVSHIYRKSFVHTHFPPWHQLIMLFHR